MYKAEEHLAKRVRCASYMQAKMDIEDRYPGESKTVFRARLLSRSIDLAVDIAASIARLKPKQKVQCKDRLDSWITEWKERATNPNYVPRLQTITSLTDYLADFVDEVLPGVNEHYFCRQKTCGHIGLAAEWPHNHPNGQYRCPLCAEQYRPWLDKPGYYKANKVYVTCQDAVTDEMHQRMTAKIRSEGMDDTGPPDASNAVPDQQGGSAQWKAYPIVWQDTSTRNLITELKAIAMEIDEEMGAVCAEDRLEYILDRVNENPPPAYMTHQPMDPGIAHRLDMLSVGAPGKPPWQYGHIKEAGFWTTKLKNPELLDQPFEQEDFLRVMGMSMWLTLQVMSSL